MGKRCIAAGRCCGVRYGVPVRYLRTPSPPPGIVKLKTNRTYSYTYTQKKFIVLYEYTFVGYSITVHTYIPTCVCVLMNPTHTRTHHTNAIARARGTRRCTTASAAAADVPHRTSAARPPKTFDSGIGPAKRFPRLDGRDTTVCRCIADGTCAFGSSVRCLFFRLVSNIINFFTLNFPRVI